MNNFYIPIINDVVSRRSNSKKEATTATAVDAEAVTAAVEADMVAEEAAVDSEVS